MAPGDRSLIRVDCTRRRGIVRSHDRYAGHRWLRLAIGRLQSPSYGGHASISGPVGARRALVGIVLSAPGDALAWEAVCISLPAYRVRAACIPSRQPPHTLL